MELVSVEKKESSRCVFFIKINSNEFISALNDVAKSSLKKINVPGFRKGKAPRSFVEKYYGEKVFYEDAINKLLPAALDFAEKETNLEIIKGDRNMGIEVKDASKEGVELQATVDVMPEVKLGQYKGLKINVKKNELQQSEIDDELIKVRRSHAKLVKTEGRAAQAQDVANINFTGYIEDVAFEHGNAENFNLELGSGQFIPGFEDGVIGHLAGDEFDINVKFPDEYHVEALAGKDAIFKVKINHIQSRVMPEYNLEFVKDISKFETVEEFEADLVEKLKANKEIEFEKERDNVIEDMLVDLVESVVPESLIVQRIDAMVNEFLSSVKSRGIGLDDYLKFTGLTMEKIREGMRAEAEHNVKLMMALNKIKADENITVEDSEVNLELQKVADLYKIDLDKIKEFIPREEIKSELAFKKTFKVIVDNSINEGPQTDEQADEDIVDENIIDEDDLLGEDDEEHIEEVDESL